MYIFTHSFGGSEVTAMKHKSKWAPGGGASNLQLNLNIKVSSYLSHERVSGIKCKKRLDLIDLEHRLKKIDLCSVKLPQNQLQKVTTWFYANMLQWLLLSLFSGVWFRHRQTEKITSSNLCLCNFNNPFLICPVHPDIDKDLVLLFFLLEFSLI